MTDNDKPTLCEAFAVRVFPDVKARITAMADAETRSLGNMVQVLLDEALQARQHPITHE